MNNLHERIGSASFFAITAAYFILATRLPTDSPNLADLGPRIYPLILGVVAMVVSATWVAQTFRPNKEPVVIDSDNTSEDSHSWQKVVTLVGAATVFPLALESFTFIPTASIVLFAMSNIIAWHRPTVRQLLITGIFAIVGATGLQLLFENIMSIYLP